MTSQSKRKLSFRRIAYKAAARDDRRLRLAERAMLATPEGRFISGVQWTREQIDEIKRQKAEIAAKVDLPYLVSLGMVRTSDDLLKLKNDYWFINADPQ